jgi:hypothetical protein
MIERAEYSLGKKFIEFSADHELARHFLSTVRIRVRCARLRKWGSFGITQRTSTSKQPGLAVYLPSGL